MLSGELIYYWYGPNYCSTQMMEIKLPAVKIHFLWHCWWYKQQSHSKTNVIKLELGVWRLLVYRNVKYGVCAIIGSFHMPLIVVLGSWGWESHWPWGWEASGLHLMWLHVALQPSHSTFLLGDKRVDHCGIHVARLWARLVSMWLSGK